jgi:hypothetical protein
VLLDLYLIRDRSVDDAALFAYDSSQFFLMISLSPPISQNNPSLHQSHKNTVCVVIAQLAMTTSSIDSRREGHSGRISAMISSMDSRRAGRAPGNRSAKKSSMDPRRLGRAGSETDRSWNLGRARSDVALPYRC